MRTVALVARHQSLFEHELHQLQRGGISIVLTKRFMHLAHGAGAMTPQYCQDGNLGVGWKRWGSRLFGKGSGGHASSIIRSYSFVNEIIRMTEPLGDNLNYLADALAFNFPHRNLRPRSSKSELRTSAA